MNFTVKPFERMMRQRPGTDSGHPCKHCRHKWECGYLLHQCRSAGGPGAVAHQNSPRSGHQLLDTSQRSALQRREQGQGLVQIGQLDQQRVVGHGQEAQHSVSRLQRGVGR